MSEREPLLEAIVLAAGAGARFGGGKLLARWGQGTVLSAAVASALYAPVRRVMVVTGCDGDVVGAEARRTAAAHGASDRLNLTHALNWAEGMAASLRAGFSALPADTEAAFVFLGDMPCVPREITTELAEALVRASAACPLCDGRRGHPALIGNSLFRDVAMLRGDVGARKVMDRLGPALALVKTNDPGVLRDIDTVADLVALNRV